MAKRQHGSRMDVDNDPTQKELTEETVTHLNRVGTIGHEMKKKSIFLEATDYRSSDNQQSPMAQSNKRESLPKK